MEKEVRPEQEIGREEPFPTIMLEWGLEGVWMEERLLEDEERCEDAPESMYEFAWGCYSVMALRTLARAA